jgi:hypothetical protein
MLYRVTAVFIVIFWLAMTGLLLRNELQPGDSALREVPFTHVVKLIFHHEQSSDLNIYSDKLRLGHLRLQPRADKQNGTRTIEYSGHLQLLIPGAKRQRIAWDGELEMNKALETRRFRFALRMHEPATLVSEITVLPAEKVARYELISPTGTLERQDYSLDERGARTVLEQIGLDPALLMAAQSQRSTPPRLKAQQSSMAIHGERIDTYLVTLEHNGQTLLEFHVDQLGHILRATTLLGYTLTPDDILP